jgi:hypothetical protein
VQWSDDDSGSEESDDGLVGTEHYAAVRYGKLLFKNRKVFLM